MGCLFCMGAYYPDFTVDRPRSQAQRGGGGETAWFQPFTHALNHGEIPPPPLTIDILLYTCDAILILSVTLTVDLS